MQTIQDRVIDRINKEIGSDIKNLRKSTYLIQSYKQQFYDVEGKLNINDDKYTSCIKSVLKQKDQTCKTIEFELEKIQHFDKKLSEKIVDCSKVLNDVSPHLQKIKLFQHMIEYLKIVKDIQDISNALSSAINGKDETKIVGLFLSLYDGNESCNSVFGRLQSTDAPHLLSFATKSAVYWHEKVKEKFSNDIETVLKNIKWGQQGLDFLTSSPSKDSLNKLSLLAEYLFLIKSPVEDSDIFVTITSSILCPPISTPNLLLLNQFRQRFEYHFYGQRQTNRLDKPEWYYTQVLNWCKETHLFIGKHFQSAAAKAGRNNLNVRLEFIRGLVQLTIEKLANDIEDINKDENLFAHLLDETLAFEMELKETIGYPSSFPSAIAVITQPQYLLKWISIEERFCTDKMDIILQSENSPWMIIDPNTVEDLKIPKCADQFIRLLDAIRDRYCSLTQPGHQLQFLNLQLELIDNFRRRLVQLHGSGTVKTTQILNTINYVNSVLREWGENVHYLHLHAALVGPNAVEVNSVFDVSVEELEHWQRKLVKEFSLKIVDEIKAKSMIYRHDAWSTMSEQNTREPFILSPSAGEMFQIMVTSLHELEKELSTNLFNISLRLIANKLDDFFLDSMVMNTKFSVGGAAQFQFDITRNLFALFGQYSRRPDLLFKKVHDICILLTMPRGNAALLHQTLSDDFTIEYQLNTLKELGVVNLKPKTAIDILERRKDINLY